MSESELEMATRHVAQAESIIAHQREIIAELDRDGHDVTKALDLLKTYKKTLAVSRLHVDRLTEGSSNT
jgi:hypothetical protein